MPISNEKHSDNLIARFQQLSGNTTRWALLFFIALLYTWITSIFPRSEVINKYVTTINKQHYFEDLQRSAIKTKRSSRVYNVNIFDSLVLVKDTSNITFKRAEVYLADFYKKDNPVKMNPERLVFLIDSAGKLPRAQKKEAYKKIKQEYLPSDVIVAMAEIPKREAFGQRDSISNKVAITFNVPGISSINFGFVGGLVVWMMLNVVLLWYLFSVRQILIQLLKNIIHYRLKTIKYNQAEWSKLDLRPPLWFAPVVFRKSAVGFIYKSLVKWTYPGFINFAGILFLLFLLGLQLYVAWLLWHVSTLPNFESSFFRFVALLFLFGSLLVFLLWLRPVSMSGEFMEKAYQSVGRREFIKLGVASLTFLFLIPFVARSVPVMKGQELKYKRTRKQQKNKYSIDIEDGLYLRKSGGHTIVYFFYKKVCTLRKRIPEASMVKILPQLTKIDYAVFFTNAEGLLYSIPDWPFVIETIAYEHALKDDYALACEVLLFGLTYATRRDGSDNSYSFLGQTPVENDTVIKFRNTLAGLVIRTGAKKPEVLPKICTLIEKWEGRIRPDFFAGHDIDRLRDKKSFRFKWVETESLPWKQPKILPWMT